jgi:hypothetical protein
VAYLFVDGVAERLHAGMPREAVLCAWGITQDGQKVLLHLAPGTKEDTASCTGFFEDLKRRGLIDPLLVVKRPVLKLMYAAVIRAADRWRGIQVGEFEQRQLRAIRDELDHAHAQRVAPAVGRATASVVQKLRK